MLDIFREVETADLIGSKFKAEIGIPLVGASSGESVSQSSGIKRGGGKSDRVLRSDVKQIYFLLLINCSCFVDFLLFFCFFWAKQ